jgi:hypothetical protein
MNTLPSAKPCFRTRVIDLKPDLGRLKNLDGKIPLFSNHLAFNESKLLQHGLLKKFII